jgi:hypothetical protein
MNPWSSREWIVIGGPFDQIDSPLWVFGLLSTDPLPGVEDHGENAEEESIGRSCRDLGNVRVNISGCFL